MPLPLEYVEQMVPRPGFIFVDRDEQPLTYGHIIIPESVRASKRASLATVAGVGPGVESVAVGARVLISPGVGTKLAFGEREERVLYVCRPQELLCALYEEGATSVEVIGEAVLGRHPVDPSLLASAHDRKADEGAVQRP